MRERAVPAQPLRRDFDGHVALVGQVNGGDIRMDRADHIGEDKGTFIKAPTDVDAIFLKLSDNGLCSTSAANLFILCRRDLDRVLWLETVGGQSIHCLHQADNAAFHIQHAASPDEPI